VIANTSISFPGNLSEPVKKVPRTGLPSSVSDDPTRKVKLTLFVLDILQTSISQIYGAVLLSGLRHKEPPGETFAAFDWHNYRNSSSSKEDAAEEYSR
jgi:hypothetical protein